MPSLTFHEDKDKATVALQNINIYPSSAVIHIFPGNATCSLYQRTYEKNKKNILLYIVACTYYDESFLLILIYEKYVVLLISISHAHK